MAENLRSGDAQGTSTETTGSIHDERQTSEQSADLPGSTDDSLNSYQKRHRSTPPWVWIVAVIAAVAIAAGGVFAYRHANSSSSVAETSQSISIGLKLAPTNLDIRNEAGAALDQVLIGNVYEGLVARNSENAVVPALAKSWTISKDAKTYTFTLHAGERFSNGDALDSKDVVWSLNSLIDNDYVNAQALANVESVSADGTTTVVLKLKAPDAALLWNLTGRAGLVLDEEAHYDAKTQAIGSGPYLVDSFKQNESLTLKANPRYWGSHQAKTHTVVLRYITDDNAAINALKSNNVQVLAPITANLSSSVSNDGDVVVKAGNDTDKFVLAFNSTGPKTADKRVRQAIRYAIDNKALISSRGGADELLGGPIPSLDPGYEDLTKLYPFNQNKAKELLSEAGYSTSKPLKLDFEYANIYGTEIGDQLRSQLKAVGIDLNVKVVEFSAWLNDVYTNKNYDLSLVDHNESHDFNAWANPEYYFNYDNKQVQELYAKAVSSTSDAAYESYLKQAARLVSEDAPADWLFNYRVTTAYRKSVTGFPLNLNQSLLPLWNVQNKA
ncbi:ABC transporter substrate-binding protein [Bifidobacterium aquikefiricola]|uniref:ABC transporter substrate-binding protein n=1 Tax=Bifidobacterium aquikefiricola TaxID=3059038 RepID=A0AB39U895_9BIFI